MQQHVVHRIVTWGWSQGWPSWRIIASETRNQDSYGYENPAVAEVAVATEFETHLAQAKGMFGNVDPSNPAKFRVRYPGPPEYSYAPLDRYYVGILGWTPGMPNWEWQHGAEVVHRAQFAPSTSDSSQAILEQVGQIEVPQQPDAAPPAAAPGSKNWVGVAILGAGLLAAGGLAWLVVRDVRQSRALRGA